MLSVISRDGIRPLEEDTYLGNNVEYAEEISIDYASGAKMIKGLDADTVQIVSENEIKALETYVEENKLKVDMDSLKNGTGVMIIHDHKLSQKQEKQAEKEQQISDVSTEKHLGYFPLKNINDSLGCKRFIDLMQTATNFRFNIFDMMSALIYARTVQPCSKSKLMMRLSQISLKTTIFHWTSCIPVWSTLAPNTKR